MTLNKGLVRTDSKELLLEKLEIKHHEEARRRGSSEGLLEETELVMKHSMEKVNDEMIIAAEHHGGSKHAIVLTPEEAAVVQATTLHNQLLSSPKPSGASEEADLPMVKLERTDSFDLSLRHKERDRSNKDDDLSPKERQELLEKAQEPRRRKSSKVIVLDPTEISILSQIETEQHLKSVTPMKSSVGSLGIESDEYEKEREERQTSVEKVKRAADEERFRRMSVDVIDQAAEKAERKRNRR